jgi:hypothetical protein
MSTKLKKRKARKKVFTLEDAIKKAKSLETTKLQFTEKEKRQIISALILSCCN